MDEQTLKKAIAALEAQRATLGDEVVDLAIQTVRAQYSADPTEQRKQVTILFADFCGFTQFSEMHDAEEVTDQINNLWQTLDPILIEHGGWIDKHIGDAVMAIWGATISREDDAQRAVEAALAIRSALQSSKLKMRIGIHSGLAIISEVGSHQERTAMGDTVNLASRLQNAAPVNSILISQETADLVRGHFKIEAYPPIIVKGKTQPIQTYLVHQRIPRAFFMPTRGLKTNRNTNFIGREQSLRILQQCLEQTGMRSITIIGDAGVGKSRLLAEFLQTLPSPNNFLILRARSWSQTQSIPYYTLRDLLYNYAGIHTTEDPQTARNLLTNTFKNILPQEGDEAAAFVGQLIGLDFSQNPWIRPILEDQKQIRNRAIVLLYQILQCLSAQTKILVLLEDLHWADPPSIQIFHDLMQQDFNLMLVALTRSDFWQQNSPWTNNTPPHQHLHLAPLPIEKAQELALELLKGLATPPPWLVNLLAERGEGNPYFTEELVNWLIEQKIIYETPQGWQTAAEKPPNLTLPNTIQGVLQARIEQLNATERILLQQAATFGRAFWDGALQTLSSQSNIQPILVSLSKQGLIHQAHSSQIPGQTEYHFHHILLRDVVYELTLRKSRRIYHKQTAEWLIQVNGARSDEWSPIIADHYQNAELPEQAAYWYLRAAERSVRSTGYQQAATYYQAVQLAADLLPTELRIQFHTRYALVLHRLSLYEEAIQQCYLWNNIAQQTTNLPEQIRAQCSLAELYARNGNIPQSKQILSELQHLLSSPAIQPAEKLRFYEALSWVSYYNGDAQQILSACQQGLQISATLPEANQQRDMLLNNSASAYWLLGDYDQAIRSWQIVLEHKRQEGDRYNATTVLNNLGATAYMQGDYLRAATIFEQCQQSYHHLGGKDNELLAASNLGGALAAAGEYEKAEHILRATLPSIQHHRYESSNTCRFLAEALLGQGKLFEALSFAQQALNIAEQVQSPDLIGRALRTIGQVLSQTDTTINLEEKTCSASDCFQRSIAIFEQKQALAEIAHTKRAWGLHEQSHHNPQQAQSLLEQARSIYKRLNLSLHLQRT